MVENGDLVNWIWGVGELIVRCCLINLICNVIGYEWYNRI